MSFTDWLLLMVQEFMNDIFGDVIDSTLVNWLLSFLAMGVLGMIAWYLWRYHPGLFQLQEQSQTDYENTEDTIYGVDFETGIAHSLTHEDYREAIRLRYLQTLKKLSDASLIDWQPFKTPNQYVQEFSASSLCSDTVATGPAAAFRSLTAHFLRIRYGNFPATSQLYDEVDHLRKEVAHES